MFRFYFRYLFTLAKMRGKAGSPDKVAKAEIEAEVDKALETMVIAGSADTGLEKLIAFRDEVGHFGTLVSTGHDWDDADLWRYSIRSLAEEVMPSFSQHAEAS